MKKNRNLAARWVAVGAGLLGLAGGLSAAEPAANPVYDRAEVDEAPALVSRLDPRVPAAHQPYFGARLRFAFVVDALGQAQDVRLLEAIPIFIETGIVVREMDVPAMRRVGLLVGLPENVSFAELGTLLTRPFVEPAREAIRQRRYRPGRKGGSPVATRLTDVIEYRSENPPPTERRAAAAAPALPEPSPSSRPAIVRETVPAEEPTAPRFTPPVLAIVTEPGSSAQTPGQIPSSVVSSGGGGGIVYTPGQPPSTVVPSSGGGRTIFTPGQAPTTVVPVSNTESVIFTPGQPQSTITSHAGGSTIHTPGQPPTLVVSTGDGGSIIYAPGQPPVIVSPGR